MGLAANWPPGLSITWLLWTSANSSVKQKLISKSLFLISEMPYLAILGMSMNLAQSLAQQLALRRRWGSKWIGTGLP